MPAYEGFKSGKTYKGPFAQTKKRKRNANIFFSKTNPAATKKKKKSGDTKKPNPVQIIFSAAFVFIVLLLITGKAENLYTDFTKKMQKEKLTSTISNELKTRDAEEKGNEDEDPFWDRHLNALKPKNERNEIDFTERDSNGAVRQAGTLNLETRELTPRPTEEQTSVEDTSDSENTSAYIYLAKYDEAEKKITLIPKKRKLGSKPGPVSAVRTLLRGVSQKEEDNNILSCVPASTKLLNSRLQGKTLYLDFNYAFELNELGREGLLIQIYQIVNTATQFDSVDEVVFLIEGEEKEALGGDGAVSGSRFKKMSAGSAINVN